MNTIQASAAPAVPVVSRLLLDILIATNSPLKCKSVWMVPSVSVLLLRPRHQGTMERVGGEYQPAAKTSTFYISSFTSCANMWRSLNNLPRTAARLCYKQRQSSINILFRRKISTWKCKPYLTRVVFGLDIMAQSLLVNFGRR